MRILCISKQVLTRGVLVTARPFQLTKRIFFFQLKKTCPAILCTPNARHRSVSRHILLSRLHLNIQGNGISLPLLDGDILKWLHPARHHPS
jgi:hypothetical protein